MPYAPAHPCPRCKRATTERFCPRCVAPVERERMVNEPWRAWYRTPRWKALRWEVLTEALFRCQCEECQGQKTWPRATIADHKVRHGGDPVKFWDKANVQALAKRCHDRKTAREVNARRE